MTLLLLVTIPLVFGLLCLVLPTSGLRMAALVCGALGHLAVAVGSWPSHAWVASNALVGVDPLGHLFITIISVLFAATSVYLVGYHQKRLVSQRVFLACILALLAVLSVVCLSQHLGVLWVALEASTLAATPLIYFRLGARALEATWKFLLMNSVGIALALLGILCMALSAAGSGQAISLTVTDLARHAGSLDPLWLRIGFLLTLIGFGTKMGLAPLHCWLPDAHGEAPAPISALLSGAILNVAFLAILRSYQVCVAAGLGAFAGGWLITFGLISLGAAALLVIGQQHYKRLLAYTSIEHMGVLAVGIGLGAAGSYPSMLHTLHNALSKAALFMLAGFLWRIYQSHHIGDVRGLLVRSPVAGVLLLAGLCATCGLPPFGIFFSELGIIFAAARNGQWWVLGLFTLTLAVVFVGVMTAMLPVIFAEPAPAKPEAGVQTSPERWRRTTMLAAAGVLIALTFGLGAYQPAAVQQALVQAADALTDPNPAALAGVTWPEVPR